MQTKDSNKSNELTSILQSHFGGKINLARIKLISHLIIALCKVQTVTREKLTNAFDSSAQANSSFRRLQRFLAKFVLDSDLVAKLIFNLLPHDQKISLCIDRTNWKFGELNINILMLGVVYHGVAFPLMFTMLPKTGNSNSGERIDLLNRFINLFGAACIESLTADREFVGYQWLNYLNRMQIRYYIRIRNNFKVFMPHKNREIKATHLFNQLAVNEFLYYPKIVIVNGVCCYISGCKCKDDYLILISFNRPQKALDEYAQRWQIEMCFKALKSSGFDMEKTHLIHLERIERLLVVVMIAFVWCYKVGIYRNQKKPIKIKTHGRKAKSIFKYGLDYIAKRLLNAENKDNIEIFKFLSCT